MFNSLLCRLSFPAALIALVLVALIGKGQAQECEWLGKYGVIWDFSGNQHQEASAFANVFCGLAFGSAESAGKWGASVGIPSFGDLGYSQSDNNWSTWYNSYCNSAARSSTSNNVTLRFIRKFDPVVANVIDDCLRRDGLHAWIETSSDPHFFTFSTLYRTSTLGAFPHVASFDFNPGAQVSCNNQAIRPNAIIDHELIANCRRRNDDPVTISFSARGATPNKNVFHLDAINAEKPQPQIVKAHMLYVAQVQNLNAGIVNSDPGFQGTGTKQVGYSIEQGPASDTPLYVCVTPNVNAGFVVTIPTFRGHACQPYGYMVNDDYKKPRSVQLFLATGSATDPNANASCLNEVTTSPGHQGCNTVSIGWTYW